MTFADWLTNLQRFFTIFLTGPFILQLIFASLDAILCVGHLHLKKKDIFNKCISFAIMFCTMFFSCMLFNSSADFFIMRSFLPYLIILSIIIPGLIYILFTGKASLENKIIKSLLYVSSAYAVTEISHHVNILCMTYSLPSLLQYLPNVLMPIIGFLVGFYNINRYPNTNKSNLFLSICVFVSLFAITLLSSMIKTDSAFIRIIFILVLIAFLFIESGIYIGIYVNSKKQETILEYQAQAKLNDAAYLTLKLNEESITRASMMRHDLKNHCAYLNTLLQEKNMRTP